MNSELSAINHLIKFEPGINSFFTVPCVAHLYNISLMGFAATGFHFAIMLNM